jgi:hypothetical protein
MEDGTLGKSVAQLGKAFPAIFGAGLFQLANQGATRQFWPISRQNTSWPWQTADNFALCFLALTNLERTSTTLARARFDWQTACKLSPAPS